MKRPWHIWVLFALCLAVVLAAMTWMTRTTLRLHRAEARARRQAALAEAETRRHKAHAEAERRRQAVLEENVRLALWRMDSALAPMIARENARPYFAYSPFYPAERAYTRMFAEIRKGEVLIPSPLLNQVSPYILLHFQFDPQGRLTSPQVPTGNMRDLAEAKKYTTHEKVLAAERRFRKLAAMIDQKTVLSALLGDTPAQPVQAQIVWRSVSDPQAQQKARTTNELRARINSVDNLASERDARLPQAAGASGVRESGLKPVWVRGALLLARRISVKGEDYVQGGWLDWPAIQAKLRSEAESLLPNAQLVPLAEAEESGDDTRLLAALPAHLVPGELPAKRAAPTEPAAPAGPVAGSGGLPSPTWMSLLVAWGCVLVAATAVAVLLSGAVSLSERRGAFVSAVTHEMRTPLTTFRMYTEMLAEGMVSDEEKRRSYLDTLRSEADRLGHLVENVLAYARLERGAAGERLETITLRELLDRTTDRLAQRAEQADMTFAPETDGDALAAAVRTDPSAVEQILFNLVDNACKYAGSAADRTIRLEAGRTGRFAALRVRDHGPGVPGEDRGRLFRPFCKSARDAANSAPGVGLGLALSRRLARSMGGDLRLDDGTEDGACFVLTLPTA